ncbi:MAG: hypothetical protein UU14_C0031G0002 [Candidatus Roizmanbacteria bacterium GW2011_GWB1_40_7]|uniref:Uncharacterized protein n=1 Tax=Candidatus Roizmanbacteria bacterium GW2011_GWB1_40_7 TaxID=1618482 RepID=A0A0G0VGX4_9BACT|nr:MAG: hypothetical protein UU14_C0031G0002 [Candidatus Roizmanbacteria bacterium GW2011_GWB1_40_7]
MSVEQLMSSGNDASHLIDIEKIKAGKRFVTDPRYVVANAYINQGKELIMKLFGLSDHGKMTTALVDDLESRLAPTQRQSLSINYAGILLGVSLHTVVNILRDNEFNAKNFVDEHNVAAMGYSKLNLNGDTMQIIPSEQWKKIINYASQDPTFGIFFNEGFTALPQTISDFLLKSGRLTLINKALLPPYRLQVQDLIAKRSAEKKQTKSKGDAPDKLILP